MKDYKERFIQEHCYKKEEGETEYVMKPRSGDVMWNFIEQLISERDKGWEKKYTEVKVRVKESDFEGWKFFPVFVQAEDKEFFERKFDRAMKAEVDYQVEERLKTLIK